MRLPTAAERLIERDLVGELRLADRNQSLLSGVERALRIEGSQIVVYSRSEAHLRQAIGVSVGGHEGALCVALIDVGAAGAEGVRDFAESCLDGELVLRDGHVLLDVRQVEIRAVLTSGEDGQSNGRREAPGTRAGTEEPLQ